MQKGIRLPLSCGHRILWCLPFAVRLLNFSGRHDLARVLRRHDSSCPHLPALSSSAPAVMSYSPPRIFLSATATGLRSVLETIKEARLHRSCPGRDRQLRVGLGDSGRRIAREDRILPGAHSHRRDQIRCGAGSRHSAIRGAAPQLCSNGISLGLRGAGTAWQRKLPDPCLRLSGRLPLRHGPWDRDLREVVAAGRASQPASKRPYFCGCPESVEDMRAWALGLQKQFPPPPPPPPPPSPPPPEEPPQSAMPVFPYSEKLDWLASQAARPLPETPSHPPQAWIPGNTPRAPSAPKRSRLPLVLVVLAAMGAVAILAAAWLLKQKGFFGHQVALQKKPEIKTVPAVKADSRVTPEPKPSTPAPTPVLVAPPPQPQPPAILPSPHLRRLRHPPRQSQRSLCLPPVRRRRRPRRRRELRKSTSCAVPRWPRIPPAS